MQKWIGFFSIIILALLGIVGILQDPDSLSADLHEFFTIYGKMIAFFILLVTTGTGFYFSNVSLGIIRYNDWDVKFFKTIEAVSLLIVFFICGVYFDLKDSLYFTLASLVYFGLMISQVLDKDDYLNDLEKRSRVQRTHLWDIAFCMSIGIALSYVLFELRMPIISFGYLVFNFFAFSVYVKIKK